MALAEILLWRSAKWLGRRVSRRLRLPWLRAWLGRLPPALALPMFLVPELASRAGAIWAAWLLLGGHYRAATILYVGSKVTASLVAVWIYGACEPALLKVGWFAQVRAQVLLARDWALAAIRRGGRDRGPSRFTVHRRRVAAKLAGAVPGEPLERDERDDR